MQDIYFIADLHLRADAPELDEAFIAFCHRIKDNRPYLYILGDLFDVWLGDDMMSTREKRIAAAIMTIRQAMGRVFFQAGNRDFLIGSDFLQASGCQALNEETIVEHNSVRIFLTHGDNLCTADKGLQKTRRQTRSPAWRKAFLAKKPNKRLDLSQNYFALSDQHKKSTTAAQLTIPIATLRKRLKDSECNVLIHGHTHTPNELVIQIRKKPIRIITLGDWTKKAWFALLENKDGATVRLRNLALHDLNRSS